MSNLQGKRLIVTGASRGIGRAIALRAAEDGAKVAIVAKTQEPHPKLDGTIYSVSEEVERAGGQALPIATDLRDANAIASMVEAATAVFGGIDILVNNASAIFRAPTAGTPIERFDLMHSVNVRATFACTSACLPHLRRGVNPHILTISPPLNLNPRWFAPHLAYTLSKYGMSLCVLGHSEELRSDGIAVNALWPKTPIATAAVANLSPDRLPRSRHPGIVADAAHAILVRDARHCTGNFYLDEEVLRQEGMTDFRQYAFDPNTPPGLDIFLDDDAELSQAAGEGGT
ncbi:MAG: NAD(P)-dependent oxidoreductase [Azospirillaceae bacterium]